MHTHLGIQGSTVHHSGAALGQGAGLVENHGAQARHLFQGFSRLDQDAVLGGHAWCGRRQWQGAQ